MFIPCVPTVVDDLPAVYKSYDICVQMTGLLNSHVWWQFVVLFGDNLGVSAPNKKYQAICSTDYIEFEQMIVA
jgi:hypothetical protein